MEIVNSPKWQAATGFAPLSASSPSTNEDQQQVPMQHHCWLRAASSHARLTDTVHGLTEDFNGGVDATIKNSPPFHPLHVAASQGLVQAGRAILEGCSRSGDQSLAEVLNTADAAGCTPLHWASITGRLGFMRLLLQHGARVDSRDHAGRTPLYACAAFGGLDAVGLLLDHRAAVDAEDYRGLSPLHAAAAGNHLEVAKELINAGAHVTRRASVGCTPKHVAARQGHAAMVQLLIDAASQSRGIGDAPDEAKLTVSGGGDSLSLFVSHFRAAISGRSEGAQWMV